MRVCKVPNCGRKHHAKGLCHTCYTAQEIRNKKRNKSVIKPVTHTPPKTETITPGTSFDSIPIDVHRFFYYCNYKGLLEGKALNKKGWYKLSYNDFTTTLPIINSQLQLTKDSKISINFTKTNNTLALGIEGHSWPSVEAMEADAYIMTQILETELNIETDNLHREKLRTREGHIGRPDKSVEKLQEEGLGYYIGKTTFNPGHFTESHPGDIQYERTLDSKRDAAFMEFMDNPIIDDPEERTRGAFEGLSLNRALAASVKVQMQTQKEIQADRENLTVYVKAVEEHNGFVVEAREFVGEAKEILMELKNIAYTKQTIRPTNLNSKNKKSPKRKGNIWNWDGGDSSE